jgi:hypothetical protein
VVAEVVGRVKITDMTVALEAVQTTVVQVLVKVIHQMLLQEHLRQIILIKVVTVALATTAET